MNPATIIATVAAVTGVPVAAITGKRRTRAVVYARFLAIAAVRKVSPWMTLMQTGEIFRRDHGAIMHAMLRHTELLKTDAYYRRCHHQIAADLAAEILTFHAV